MPSASILRRELHGAGYSYDRHLHEWFLSVNEVVIYGIFKQDGQYTIDEIVLWTREKVDYAGIFKAVEEHGGSLVRYGASDRVTIASRHAPLGGRLLSLKEIGEHIRKALRGMTWEKERHGKGAYVGKESVGDAYKAK